MAAVRGHIRRTQRGATAVRAHKRKAKLPNVVDWWFSRSPEKREEILEEIHEGDEFEKWDAFGYGDLPDYIQDHIYDSFKKSRRKSKRVR